MGKDSTNIEKETRFSGQTKTLKIAWMICFFASFIYIGTEWLFLITKPSSMSMVSPLEKLSILLFGISMLTFAGCFLQLLISLLFRGKIGEKAWSIKLLMSVPGVVLAAAILLIVDNFTYTTMGFGIITSKGPIRALYGLSFLGLVFYLIQDLSRLHQTIRKIRDKNGAKRRGSIYIGLASLMLITITAVFISGIRQKIFLDFGNIDAANRKNIILITADGLNAERMSVYGYEKETTPFLKSIASKALIAQNNFTNSGSTTGSLTSMLTGRYPTSVRVLFHPDILRGEDSYRSLPAILKSSGYHNEQYSIGFYADAYAINFKNAFDFANGYTAKSNRILGIANLPIPSNYEYFLYELQSRLLPRLKHIFFVRVMENEFQEVTNLAKFSKEYADKEKILQALDTLAHTEQPVFLHLHWMKTHGPYFKPRNRVFSAGQDADHQDPWDTLFYEDVILDFDEDLAYLYNELEKMDILDDTVIIIGTDHANIDFVTFRRIPLMILFPNGEHAGKILNDTQNLDTAPTILDYLGMDAPEWMEGKSLLSDDLGYRPILSVQNLNTTHTEEQGWITDDAYNNPPFYQFDAIGVQNCGRITELNLENFHWSKIEVSAYQSQCDSKDILDDQTIREIIIERLRKDKFEFDEALIPFP